MMILQRLDLQLRAVIRSQPETFIAAIVCREVLVQFRLVIIKQRIMAKRPFAIRTAFGVHFQQAEIDPQLNFLLAVFAL